METPNPVPTSDVSPKGVAARPARHFQSRRWMFVGLAAAVIVLILVALVGLKFVSRNRPAATAAEDHQPVAGSVLTNLTTIPPAEFASVGEGSAQGTFATITGPVLRASDGHPQIVYIGAEYCPFCAAERWAMIVALSQFGTFTGLETSHSAADDVYPSTPTFSFYRASYQSNYVDFAGVELLTNTRVNGQYQPLQTMSPSEQALFQKYDAPPYVSGGSTGSIPFLDVANQYVLTGATYDPTVLKGKSWDAIAASLHDPASPEAKAIIGSANLLTAAICTANGNTPSNVCSQPSITTIQHRLSVKLTPGSGG